jgi:microcystin degradation protein MlrC
VLEKDMNDVAVGIFWDPGVVRICKAAGKGAVLDLCLGGKHGPVSGLPLNITAEIMNITSNQEQAMGDGDVMMPLGNLIWLKMENNINILVNDIRNQALSRLPFLEIGIELEKLGTIIVKSSNHFFNSFDVVAEEIIHVSGPGAMSFDSATIPYKKRDGNYWPKVENPHN